MEQRLYQRLGLLPAILALAAIAILLGLGTHGHHDDCHDFCWVCHSSVADIGLPAETAVLLVIWSTHSVANDFVLAPHDFDANLHTAPRAPPC